MKQLIISFLSLFVTEKSIKKKSVIEKINFLLKNVIQSYNINFITNSNYFIESDIIAYTYALKSYMELDYMTVKVKVRPIISGTHHYLTYGKWFSPKGGMLTDTNNDIINWLNTAKEFYLVYQNMTSDHNNQIAVINSGKIKPYIINIEQIVDDLLTYRLYKQ